MPILRLNAGPAGPTLHGSPASAMRAINSAAAGSGPVIVMIHGFKYDPDCDWHSPHKSIFATTKHPVLHNTVQWLHHLGFGCSDPEEGLAIAFAWRARCSLWEAQKSARSAGQQLADVITAIHNRAPHRPVNVVTHSMGSEVILEALHSLPAHSVARIVTLTGASYVSRASAALGQTDAGRAAQLINVTSRENEAFDFMFERLTRPPESGDRAMGRGLDLNNAVTLYLDCPQTLALLSRFGGHIAPRSRRICHWSGYTRPGALRFYAHALRNPQAVPLHALRQALPTSAAPLWPRILTRSHVRKVLPSETEMHQGPHKVT